MSGVFDKKPNRKPNSTCLICEKKFYCPPSRIQIGCGKFCSYKCLGKFKKGKRDSNLNPKARLGLKPWNYGMHGYMAGSVHYNWQGGKTSKLKKLRNSLQYKEWRQTVFERDDFTCQLCKKRGGDLQADHIKPFSKYPELRFEISNGRTLCVSCHVSTETYGKGALCA